MKGAAPGKLFRVQMLDVEGVKVKEVKVRVKGVETLPDGGRALHLLNDLFPMVDNDIWVDPAGNTIRESVRDGLVETRTETEESARRFIAEAALSRRDMILDFSLVRVEPPLLNAASISRLTLEVDGIPQSMPLVEGGGQEARRLPDGKVIFTLEPGRPNGAPADQATLKRFLEPTDRLPADQPDIVARAKEVLGGEPEPRKRMEKLIRWVSAYVEDAVTDAPSPLDTLKSRKGNCQAHARLYASLARAAGLPTRFVSGIVNLEGKGFLYHSWAESYVDGAWIQVDPTFDQVPADATHVKFVEGESTEEMAAIAGVVGRIRARVVNILFHTD
jgi:transglutaminase-like putative cysteine protease